MIIGIDPDTEKSGVCVFDENLNILLLVNFDLYDLVRYITSNKNNISRIVVEAGYLNKSNFHTKQENSAKFNAKIGSHVGANHEIARQIVKYCKRLGMETIERKPKNSKVNDAVFREITGYSKRTNQEMRDAAMIVLGYECKFVDIGRKRLFD